ncbi:MAG: MauE/DoxX family redox-associated membrane protein [Thermoanaerobaculia bacterium]
MMETVVPVNARTQASRAPSHPILWWVGTFGGAFLGCVLLFAVWAKMIDPAAFAEQIRAEGLDGILPAQAIAMIALALEVGLGLALLLGLRRLWVLVPTTLLVAFFLFLTGRAWWLDSQGLLENASSCGCFGNLVERTPAQAFWQDLLLLVPALALAFLGRERRTRLFPPFRTAVVVLGTVAVLVFAWMAPGLPLDDLATRLRPGVAIESLCAGRGDERVCLDSLAPDLREGDHLVLMTNLDAPELTGAMDALNAYAGKPDSLPLLVLSSATAEEQRAFFWQWGPAFEVREAPAELLRPLYRRLPRAFLVKDGRVTRTFPGLPPQIAASPTDLSERSSK